MNISVSINCTLLFQGGVAGTPKLRDSVELRSFVTNHASNGGLYGAICAAPAVVLASWGLLNGLKASLTSLTD